MLTLLLVFLLMAALIGIVISLSYEPVRSRVFGYFNKKTEWATGQLDTMFMEVPRQKLFLRFLLGPVIGTIAGFVVMRNPLGAVVGLAVGLVLPQIGIMQMKAKRRKQFGDQLVDGLMILSSSLKAGLSILQAFEVLVEEMAQPLSQEFGLVLKETKMGVSMQESLQHLKQRMPSDDLNLVVTAVLVARETGGDVTQVFSRLIDTIRERKKLVEKVKTLTVQGRIQGVVMSALPVVFGFTATSFSADFFKPFLTDPVGHMLLVTAITLQVVGTLLIFQFARVKT